MEEEIDVLLGEIPRATSAPPHFDDGHGSLGDELPFRRRTEVITKKVPSLLLPYSGVSNFHHAELVPTDTPLRINSQHLRFPPNQQDHRHLQPFQQSQRELGNELPRQFSYGDESLRSTFENLNLQGDPDPSQLLPQNGNGYEHCGNTVNVAPEAFLVQSAMRSTCRMPSSAEEPITNGSSSVSVGDEPNPHSTAQKLHKLMRPQGLDWNSPLQATGVDRRFFQEQGSASPQYSQAAMLRMATSKSSACRGSDPHANGFQVEALPDEFHYDGAVLSYVQQQKLQFAHQVAVDGHQQQFQDQLRPRQHLLEPQYANLHGQVRSTLGASHYLNYVPAIPVPGIASQQSSDQQHQVSATLQTDWSKPNGKSLMGLAEQGNHCRYFSQGHCIRGDTCPFLHLHRYGQNGVSASSLKETLAAASQGKDQRLGTFLSNKNLALRSFQSNGDHASVALTGRRRRKDFAGNGHLVSNGHAAPPVPVKPVVQQLLVLDKDGMHSSHEMLKFSTLEEVEGRIYNMAKDQHGCRFLQRKFDEGKPEDVSKIFEEIRDHIVELMTDPFGNYLVQKLLEVCNEEHRMEILNAVTQNDVLVTISVNMHGTRAVQKLIETLRSPEQVSMVRLSLKRGVVTLIKDLNGNHVVQRCLQRLSNEDSQFIFDAAASHCVEIASHRHGCCVLQRCLDFASGMQRQFLVAEIAANALTLSQDPFGNYVVQYILELGLPWASAEVMSRLDGSYPHLAMQKFSSNVVEKCLKFATEDNKACIVKELIASSVLGQLLQDPYANYVIQSALQVTKGPLHVSLVDAIRPYVPLLRSSPYGKRILSRTHLKK